MKTGKVSPATTDSFLPSFVRQGHFHDIVQRRSRLEKGFQQF